MSMACINISFIIILVLKAGLAKNFSNVEVEVVDCPDLREKPWTLAAPGMYMCIASRSDIYTNTFFQVKFKFNKYCLFKTIFELFFSEISFNCIKVFVGDPELLMSVVHHISYLFLIFSRYMYTV